MGTGQRSRPTAALASRTDRRDPLEISDDVGTVYRRHCGTAGGHGTEFEVRWSFVPVPPAQAAKLTLRFTPYADATVDIVVPLFREAELG